MASSSIARMTREELEELLEAVVERKLIEILSQTGGLGRQSIRSRRTASGTVSIDPDEAEEGKIVDKDGVLVVRTSTSADLTNAHQSEQQRRVATFSRRIKS